MNELSIFVDESGDFGKYDHKAPFYIISLVFHDQSVNIDEDLICLETEMTNIGWPNHCVHAGPIIRSENEYQGYSLQERQRILKRLMTFTRKADIKYRSIYIEKRPSDDPITAIGNLSKQLAGFVHENALLLNSYDCIKVYYDNGQTEVTKILSSVFIPLLDNVLFKKVIPSERRLFQVADLLCTIKLTELKFQKHVISNSEKHFFQDERCFKKNYLKPLVSKRF
jgi:hypothetical protein